MLTVEGRNHIRRYMAGYNQTIAQSISFGIGARAENAGDISLEMETARAVIHMTYFDFANDRIVYKASIPEEYSGKIYEVGLYSLEDDPMAGGFGSRLITGFDSGTEDWIDPDTGEQTAFDSANTRLGEDSLAHGPGTSTSITSVLREIELDLSGYSSADTFVVAYNVSNPNASQIVIRFVTDSANYYSFSLGAQSAGYKFIELSKGAAVATGAPSWDTITEIQITTTANATGAASVQFDAIRVEDRDTQNLDYVLVARKVLTTPVEKVDGMSQDIEFTVDVTL